MASPTRLLFVLAAALGALVAPAGAEQYWIGYEGNDFPENEGWTRVYGDGHWPPEDEPDRWIEDGALVIDTSRNDQLWEYYSRPLVDLAPGEMFIAEWQMGSELLSGTRDNGVVFARQSVPAFAGFQIVASGILVSVDDVVLLLDTSIRHAFRLTSADMVTYEFSIDGALAYTGLFEADTFLQGFTAFGAGTQAASSTSQWDYFRYGVVPEPGSTMLLAVGLLATRNLR
jgi:hypothetical protein